MQSDPSTLDVTCFEALGAFDEDNRAGVLAEMVRLFIDEAREWLADAGRAIAAGDVIVLRRIGHSLKGACGTIGARRMRALAVELEHAASANNLAEAEAIVRALVDENAAVGECLRPYLL